jgi:hypothetical protein
MVTRPHPPRFIGSTASLPHGSGGLEETGMPVAEVQRPVGRDQVEVAPASAEDRFEVVAVEVLEHLADPVGG